MDKPLVSVVVRTHNRSAQLKTALQSLIDQTYRPIEVFVVDHNSTDNTREVAASFGEPVRYYRHTGSFRDTFNVWRDKIRGEFVSVLDDDDFIGPDCIEELVTFLSVREDVDVAFARHRYFRLDNGKLTVESKSVKVKNKNLNRQMLTKCVVPWNAVVFRKKCLQNSTHIDSSVTGAFDWFFWIQFAIAGCKFHQIDKFLGYIQRSSDSVQLETDRMLVGKLQCMEHYGKYLTPFQKIGWGYHYGYGYNLICYGMHCLEKNDIDRGRTILLRGIFLYCFSLKNRLKLIPAVLILFSSIISDPRKARIRIEKLLGNYLFRIYSQRSGANYSRLGESKFWNL